MSTFFFFFYYISSHILFFFFFFNDTATTEIYTLSLHDALPISPPSRGQQSRVPILCLAGFMGSGKTTVGRSEEHTSELQSRLHLVCRLLLEKKKKKKKKNKLKILRVYKL